MQINTKDFFFLEEVPQEKQISCQRNRKQNNQMMSFLPEIQKKRNL